MSRLQKTPFPKDFLWGAATAAPQIEGGYNEGGRTPSIWDIAPKTKIKNGENCHVACDHYHRYKEDVALMQQLGLQSYRFSLSWSRIIPEEGKVNPQGIAFYSNLIDALLQAGIEPLVTLYHWDLPVWVHKLGGWRSKQIVHHFTQYAKVVVDAFSDRVKYWITFNEPQCFLMNGYMQGEHAPFQRAYLSLSSFTRNFMLTHGETVKLIRAHAKQKPIIGITFAAGAFIPKDENSEKSIEEARHRSFYEGMGTMNNRWWMDPILAGKPVCAYGIYHSNKKDMQAIRQPLDFIGINSYAAFNYSSWGGDKDVDLSKLKKTYLDWVIDGRAIYWAARFIHERYGLPIMVTENGMANDDTVDKNGTVNDQVRVEYIDEYLWYVKKAIHDGVPIIGYQYWSLLDNFEWAEGYAPRFGLIHVDFATGKRTIKQSGLHYWQIIESGGKDLECYGESDFST